MVIAKRIEMEKVNEILELWEYEKDLPMGLAHITTGIQRIF